MGVISKQFAQRLFATPYHFFSVRLYDQLVVYYGYARVHQLGLPLYLNQAQITVGFLSNVCTPVLSDDSGLCLINGIGPGHFADRRQVGMMTDSGDIDACRVGCLEDGSPRGALDRLSIDC
ncbi:MAG: hypothetical protein ABIK83_14265 [Candidatus Zixiibacteriota bacterium]